MINYIGKMYVAKPDYGGAEYIVLEQLTNTVAMQNPVSGKIIWVTFHLLQTAFIVKGGK
jgi:hypothetical protein